MARPFCLRKVGFMPGVRHFKPAGIAMRSLEEVVLHLDELEALRLTDFEGLYQEDAASRMGISRPTLSRIMAEARWKVADALVHGKVLRLEGVEAAKKGSSQMTEEVEKKGKSPWSPGSQPGRCGIRRRRRRRDGSGRGARRPQAPVVVDGEPNTVDEVEESRRSEKS